MNIVRNGFCVVATLALASCATLEQAPLVYSSKTSVGVDISTTSTETPGLSMSVGFKQVDAAYVPVAVAKACQTEKNSAICNAALHRLEVIGGKEQLGNSPMDAKADDTAVLTEAIKQQLNNYTIAEKKYTDDSITYDEAIAKKTLLESAWTKKKELNKETLELDRLKTAANGASATEEDRNAAKEQQKKVDGITLTQKESAISADIATESEYDQALGLANQEIQNSADQKEKSKKAAEDQLTRFKQTKEALTNRGDSYSVFGSFRGRTGVGKGSGTGAQASVGLGKIFATGVASQKISDGLSDYYRNRGKGACYRAVAVAAVNGKVDKDVVASLLKGCADISD